jgi:DNA-directed RNA polymerase subunit beta'
MVLGIYYLTINPNADKDIEGYFVNFEDAMAAFEAGVIKLHSKISVRNEQGERIETTPGRLLFNEAVRNAVINV